MHSVASARRDRAQRGSGSLAVVLLLLVAATLAWLHANRTLVLEVRASAATLRATLAREAAEAGLAWGWAQLHAAAPTGAACTPDAAASATFIDRALPVDTADPRRERHIGTLQPACVLQPDAGWSCACPAVGAAAPPVPAASDAPAPAFRVQFAAGPQAGTVWLHSQGCSDAAPPCLLTGERSDAQRHSRQLLGLLPALARPPYATVNALGDVQLVGDVQVVNTTPGNAWTVASAGTLTLDPLARLWGLSGTPSAATAVTSDARGRASDGTLLTAERWFALHFALSRAAYRTLAHVHPLPGSTTCNSADVSAAVAAGHRVLWCDGDLTLDSPATLGQPDDPLLIVTTGALRLTAALTITGALHAGSLDWNTTALGGLRGTLNSAGPVRLAGPLRLVRDEAVLARLAHAMGTWAPAPGSWSDLDD